MKKIKGAYQSKEKMTFDFSEKLKVISELKLLKKYRFKDQIDFSINLQNPFERNPYTRAELSRSSIDLSTKIIFKEFKNFLNGDSKTELLTEPLFSELRGGTKILFIEDFAELRVLRLKRKKSPVGIWIRPGPYGAPARKTGISGPI